MDNRELLKKSLKEITIPFMYENNLKEFLENPLATELDFIQHIRKKQKEYLELIEDDIDLYFYAPREQPISDEEADKEWEKKQINDQYWFLKMYLEFLDEREQEIKSENSNIKPSEPQQTEPEPLELKTLNNHFDHKPIKKVYDYFYRELVKENKYLTESDLMQYLKIAFDEKKNPKQKFIFQNDPRKGEIINIFYRYYVDENGRVTKKRKCCELLGEYFTGYTTEKVFNNFNK